METPNNLAGKLTEEIMGMANTFLLNSRSDSSTPHYNRMYSAVLKIMQDNLPFRGEVVPNTTFTNHSKKRFLSKEETQLLVCSGMIALAAKEKGGILRISSKDIEDGVGKLGGILYVAIEDDDSGILITAMQSS